MYRPYQSGTTGCSSLAEAIGLLRPDLSTFAREIGSGPQGTGEPEPLGWYTEGVRVPQWVGGLEHMGSK